jgi:hypothetical protein
MALRAFEHQSLRAITKSQTVHQEAVSRRAPHLTLLGSYRCTVPQFSQGSSIERIFKESGGGRSLSSYGTQLPVSPGEMRSRPGGGGLPALGRFPDHGTLAFRTKNSLFSRFRGRQQFHVAKIDPSCLLRAGHDLEPERVVHEAFLRNPHHRSRFEALHDGGRPFRALSYP